MDVRETMRKHQLLEEYQVAPESFDQVLPRLRTFMELFVPTFQGQAAEQHAQTSVCGLRSDVAHQNVASITYQCGPSRLPLQGCIGWADGDDAPLRQELLGQIGKHWGQADGVLVFDPSGFPKSGGESGGVARQWCGRLGKIDHCQGALYLGYVSRRGHTLVDTWWYLPEEGAREEARLQKAGVPKGHPATARAINWPWRCWGKTALGCRRGGLPGMTRWGALTGFVVDWPLWVSGMCWRCQRTPRCVIWRQSRLCTAVGGGPPSGPGKASRHGVSGVADEAWPRSNVRDGSKGPLIVEVGKRRVVSRTHRRQPGDEELLVVIRYRDRDREPVVQVDSYLSNAAPETPGWEVARVAKAVHRIAECLQRSKSEIGLADDEVRHWTGWQHHQTLSLLAPGFLVQETRRGKKWMPAMTFPQIRQDIALLLREAFQCNTLAHRLHERQKRLQRNELALFYPWKHRKQLAPLNLHKRLF